MMIPSIVLAAALWAARDDSTALVAGVVLILPLALAAGLLLLRDWLRDRQAS